MCNTPLISVIVPVYNVEKFIGNTVNSIINQTYANLEIILIDDGSTDKSPEICDEFAASDNRIMVIHKKNGGASSARNAGLDAASGDYIAFVDADDYIDSDMYEIMLGHIIDYKADAASCGIVRENADAPDEPWGSDDAKVEIVERDALLKRVGQAIGILPVSPCNKLFSKTVIGDIRFDIRFKYAEDVLFNYYVSKNISKMITQNVTRYHYVNNSASVSHMEFDSHRFDEHKVMDIILEDTKNDEKLYSNCVMGDVQKSFRTIKRMMIAEKEMAKFDEIRDRILSHKSIIFKSGIFSKATKFKTIFLWLFPNIYKKFIAAYGKKHS